MLCGKSECAMLASFSVMMGKKEKCEHGASYARDGNFSLFSSMCISVLNWNYQIIASECPREQGAAFAVAICFLKPALFQCCLKFVCISLFLNLNLFLII